MIGIIKDKKLWNDSIEDFKKIYGFRPEVSKDYARITHIYLDKGGEFLHQESLIPFSIKEQLSKEGVFDEIKSKLSSLFKNPIVLGIALYFLNNLYKKNKK